MARHMDRHHPAGRHGSNMDKTVLLHRACHSWVHSNQRQAEALGLLVKNRNTHELTDSEWSDLLDQIYSTTPKT